jgi:hypothetical protein
VKADDNCGSMFVGSVAFVREDARRTAAAPDAQNALVISRFRLTSSPSDLGAHGELWQRLSFEERPLLVALRL